MSKTYIFSIAGLLLLTLCVYFCVSCGMSSLGGGYEEYLKRPKDGVMIEELRFSAVDDLRKGKHYTITDERVLRDVRRELASGGMPFSDVMPIYNQSSKAPADYSMHFTDGKKLHYAATILFNDESIYFNFLYPEDFGYHGDPNIFIDVTNILGDDDVAGITEIWTREKDRSNATTAQPQDDGERE